METADKLLELFIKKSRPAYDDAERRDCKHSFWLLVPCGRKRMVAKTRYPFFVQCADNC